MKKTVLLFLIVFISVFVALPKTVFAGGDSKAPTEFQLDQNYPNPFNPTTNISFSIPNESHVTLKVYNILGYEIATLVNKEMKSGNYTVKFNGSSLPSGIYFYRLQANDNVATKKLILLK